MDHGDYKARLRALGLATIHELETEQGILASGRGEAYGCIFGRDSLITSLLLLRAYRQEGDEYLAQLVRKVLLNLCALQGREINIESGEEPGKCIHEYRPTDHEHLTRDNPEPWYIYPSGEMRNYDTVDGTPLLLLALHEYHRAKPDDAEFMQAVLPHVHAAIEWVFTYGDSNGDGFIDYRFHPNRIYGGLRTQSWMDSTESLFHEDGTTFLYPIAPVEAQGYTYAALRLWSQYFAEAMPEEGERLAARAALLKKEFNERFVIAEDDGLVSLAFAIDGTGRSMSSPRSSMGHVLWAAVSHEGDMPEGILAADHVEGLVRRLMQPDLFEPQAGIRTLSIRSAHFDPYSYHNGSIWPHDTGIVAEGMERFGFHEEARQVREALINAYLHFDTPIELFSFVDGAYDEWRSPTGQTSCKKQAWSAASLLGAVA